jgi:hypothetical protein
MSSLTPNEQIDAIVSSLKNAKGCDFAVVTELNGRSVQVSDSTHGDGYFIFKVAITDDSFWAKEEFDNPADDWEREYDSFDKLMTRIKELH